MPHRKGRQCRRLEGRRGFKPMGIPGHMLEQVVLTLDEFETLRHCDLEGKQQSEAGEAMGVSRGTVQRILVRARAKGCRCPAESENADSCQTASTMK